MNLFNRIFKIGQAEAHSAVNQFEDPIKLTEQGLRDLREDLDKALHALAEVKALAIRARNDAEAERSRALDYENKAVLLLQNGERDLGRVAYALGYREQSSFNRAFRRWTDRSPSVWLQSIRD